MPMPWTYRHAQKEFQAFLADARERMNLVSDNSAYTAVQGVFITFRARLAPAQALAFADVLPAVLRAIFVAQWNIAAPPLAFDTREALTREAQALRPNHNLTPDNCIEATAWALWRYCDHARLAHVLAEIGPEAEAFWRPNSTDPAEIAQRIF